MSAAGISSSSFSQLAADSQFQGPQSSFKELGRAIASGDLATAQQIYSNLAAAQQSGSAPAAGSQFAADFAALGQALQSGNLSSAKQAFTAVRQDLRDVRSQNQAEQSSPAEEIIINLISAGQSTPQPSAAGNPTPSTPAPATSPATTDAAAPAPAEPQIVINISESNSAAGAGNSSTSEITLDLQGGNAGSGGQALTINITDQAGSSSAGSSTPEVSLNLGSSTPEIGINFGSDSSNSAVAQILLNLSSTGSTPQNTGLQINIQA
jgi:hypothetical protein